MASLNLPNPKMMDVAVPANIHQGLHQEEVARRGWAFSAEQAKGLVGRPEVALIDLREKSERERTGAIPGSLHAPYAELQDNIDEGGLIHELARTGKTIVFVCAFGERSAMAVQAAQDRGLGLPSHRGRHGRVEEGRRRDPLRDDRLAGGGGVRTGQLPKPGRRFLDVPKQGGFLNALRNDSQAFDLPVLKSLQESVVVLERHASVGIAARAEHIRMRQQARPAENVAVSEGGEAQRLDAVKKRFPQRQFIGARRSRPPIALTDEAGIVQSVAEPRMGF